MRLLWILESHPVQYRVPLYRELARLRPASFEVLYACDCSARGYPDVGFGTDVRWNIPLLDGYPHRVLGLERGQPLRGFHSLGGRGLVRLLQRTRPAAVLLTGFAYRFQWTAYLACLRLGLPIWIRVETQDQAFVRSAAKTHLRRFLYRGLYLGVRHAFPIGELNRRHFLRHGIPPERMTLCPYAVPDPLARVSEAEKLQRRLELRRRQGIPSGARVVGFSGKLIAKKNPELLLRAVQRMAIPTQPPPRVLFVGAGELENSLRNLAREIDVPATFAGFVNQAELPDYYLAMDVLALPSRRDGETWGLVVNEALHAGCAVAMSNAVGCSLEFGGWERCRVFESEDVESCAQAVREALQYPRDFRWASSSMQRYSVPVAAAALASRLP